MSAHVGKHAQGHLLERPGIGVQVHEYEPKHGVNANRHKPCSLTVEPCDPIDTPTSHEPSIIFVSPSVVRTDDAAPTPVVNNQAVRAVTAYIVEAAQDARLHHGSRTHPDRQWWWSNSYPDH